MGLNTLQSVREKKGIDWLNKFLDKELIITEKLDTFRISFEKQGNEIKFFKKDNTPINIIERCLSDIWEDALIEIPVICSDKDIPEGYRFGIAYTPIERPIRLPYTNMPKYILTDITIRKDNKIIETLNYTEINNWAGTLCMGRPPIIFQGKLNEQQKKFLLEYSAGNYEEIDEESMSRFLEKNIAAPYSKMQTIEGIILQNEDSIMQIPSYEFNILNEAYEKTFNTPRDYYDIFIMNLNALMDNYSFPILEGDNSDDRYLEVVNDIFNKFIFKYSDQYKQDSIDVKFLKSPQYNNIGKLNTKFIKNKTTKELLCNEVNESLYKIILSSLRKYKKEYGLLTESITQKFNTYVFLIHNNINNSHNLSEVLDDNINESRSENVVVKEVNRRKYTDIDNMRVISSIQAAFTPQSIKTQKGKTKCAVYVTELRPFTNSQMENILAIHKQYDVPIVIMTIASSKNILGDKFKFSDNILKGQLRSIVNFNKEIIPAFSLLESWSLYELFERCRPNYEPTILITDKGKSSEFAIQLYFEEEVMGGRINVDKDFNIAEMDVLDQMIAFRAIEDNDAARFMEVTPQSVHIFYDNFNSEYRSWRGSILMNS